MSFAKAEQLLDLATMVSARKQGVTLDEVCEKFEISLRTAQRMLHTLESRFPEVDTVSGDDGRKRWRMPGGTVRDLVHITADELASLDLGVAHLKRGGLHVEAKAVEALREKIIAMIPRQRIARLETDYDAILEAQGFVARSGPRPKINEEIAGLIAEAIKACRYVEIVYKAYGDASPKSRKLAPYGLLSGLRRYLVALDPQSRRQGAIKTYRMDAISSVKVLDEYFTRPKDFDLQVFANRAFGLFQRDAEFSTIVWRFKPEAADQARGFLFHPSQTDELRDDGSLIVRFEASGLLEMAWHLYTWGNKVEVLEPPELREMIAGYQRSDFPAMP